MTMIISLGALLFIFNFFLFNFKGNPVKRMKKLQKPWQNLIDLKKFLNKKKLSKS